MRTTYHSLQIQVNSPRARVDDLLPGGAKSTMSAAQLLWREIDLEEPGPALLKQRHLPPCTPNTQAGVSSLCLSKLKSKCNCSKRVRCTLPLRISRKLWRRSASVRPYRREENILFESTRSEKVISLLLESRSIFQHLCIFLEMFQTMQHYQLTFISLRGRGQGKRDATPRNTRKRLGRLYCIPIRADDVIGLSRQDRAPASVVLDHANISTSYPDSFSLLITSE